jgi:hypothetical protein
MRTNIAYQQDILAKINNRLAFSQYPTTGNALKVMQHRYDVAVKALEGLGITKTVPMYSTKPAPEPPAPPTHQEFIDGLIQGIDLFWDDPQIKAAIKAKAAAVRKEKAAAKKAAA